MIPRRPRDPTFQRPRSRMSRSVNTSDVDNTLGQDSNLVFDRFNEGVLAVEPYAMTAYVTTAEEVRTTLAQSSQQPYAPMNIPTIDFIVIAMHKYLTNPSRRREFIYGRNLRHKNQDVRRIAAIAMLIEKGDQGRGARADLAFTLRHDLSIDKDTIARMVRIAADCIEELQDPLRKKGFVTGAYEALSAWRGSL
jgi:hypothetical protein